MIAYSAIVLRDRHPLYRLNIQNTQTRLTLVEAGFYKIPITPEVPDTWRDANQDGQFDIDHGDYYEDLNGNEKFDPVLYGRIPK